jgi:hypothetical protein
MSVSELEQMTLEQLLDWEECLYDAEIDGDQTAWAQRDAILREINIRKLEVGDQGGDNRPSWGDYTVLDISRKSSHKQETGRRYYWIRLVLIFLFVICGCNKLVSSNGVIAAESGATLSAQLIGISKLSNSAYNQPTINDTPNLTIQHRHDRAYKNALIFFIGALGGTILFWLLSRLT